MTLELYEPRKHFPMIFRWWKAHRKGVLDLESLSPIGLVAKDEKGYVAAAWLFLTNGKVANIAWVVTNPEARARAKSDAVAQIILELSAYAKSQGYTRVISFSSSRGLTRAYERAGMTKLVMHDLLIRAL